MIWKLAQFALFFAWVWLFLYVAEDKVPLSAITFMAAIFALWPFSLLVSFLMWREKRKARKLGLPEPEFFEPESLPARFVRESEEGRRARREQTSNKRAARRLGGLRLGH
jgi:hypothetical protein